MVLSKQERSKINKANRAKGYRVERQDVLYHRERRIFAFRIPTKQQRGDLATFDVIVCKPTGTEIHQCKSDKRLLTKLEKENHIRICQFFQCIPVLCYRELYKGLRWEVMTIS